MGVQGKDFKEVDQNNTIQGSEQQVSGKPFAGAPLALFPGTNSCFGLD